jgi:hypothetical protein
MRHKANQLLLWGLIILVAGAGLVFVMQFSGMLFINPNDPSTQAGYIGVLGFAQVLSDVLPPLGAALTTAGIVLRTIVGKDEAPSDVSG